MTALFLLNKDNAHYDAIEKLITENKIGGLIFFKEDLCVRPI
jgi:hypothetical protein